MRLRTINVFSAYLGNTENTRNMTSVLRQDADFLDTEFHVNVKFYDNDFCRQLNIECDEQAKEIHISSMGLEGYPTITIPFDFSNYGNLTDRQKKCFWIENLKTIFSFLSDKMNGSIEKIDAFVLYLETKYNNV